MSLVSQTNPSFTKINTMLMVASFRRYTIIATTIVIASVSYIGYLFGASLISAQIALLALVGTFMASIWSTMFYYRSLIIDASLKSIFKRIRKES